MRTSVRIVLLPTTKIGFNNVMRYLGSDKLLFERTDYSAYKLYDTENCEPCYLYFTSGETIESGEWCIYIDGLGREELKKYTHKALNNDSSTWCKIIATTNPSLHLPKPKVEFLKYYCDNNGNLGDVYVETTEKQWEEHTINWMLSMQHDPDDYENVQVAKVDEKNHISIEVERVSWDKDAVIELIKEFNSETDEQRDSKSLNKWIKDSLTNYKF